METDLENIAWELLAGQDGLFAWPTKRNKTQRRIHGGPEFDTFREWVRRTVAVCSGMTPTGAAVPWMNRGPWEDVRLNKEKRNGHL